MFWLAIKGKQLGGLKFRRQHSIGNYIVDFYCPEHKLAIELDGGIHNNVVVHNHDTERQENLESLGVKVLRFDNEDVFKHQEQVLESILEHIRL